MCFPTQFEENMRVKTEILLGFQTMCQCLKFELFGNQTVNEGVISELLVQSCLLNIDLEIGELYPTASIWELM